MWKALVFSRIQHEFESYFKSFKNKFSTRVWKELRFILEALKNIRKTCQELGVISKFILGALIITMGSPCFEKILKCIFALEIYFSHLNHCQHIISPE